MIFSPGWWHQLGLKKFGYIWGASSSPISTLSNFRPHLSSPRADLHRLRSPAATAVVVLIVAAVVVIALTAATAIVVVIDLSLSPPSSPSSSSPPSSPPSPSPLLSSFCHLQDSVTITPPPPVSPLAPSRSPSTSLLRCRRDCRRCRGRPTDRTKK